MDLKYSDADLAFRREIRAALEEMLPPDIRERQRLITTQTPPIEDQRRWFKILDDRGWAAPHWPIKHGGTDWTPLQRFIFEDELHALNGPEFHWGGTSMVGPVIYNFGSQAQKDAFLNPTRRGDIIWAQGFSEPGSGSDLVSLRTHAKRDGDTFIVNGQKIWTSGAYESDWGFFLVKTDLTVKPQRGISFLLIDMSTPGLTVRRIPTLNGEAHLCEVFLDNVVVPAENLVGEAGMGWTYAKFLLEHERTASSFIFWSKRELARVRSIADAETRDGVPLSQTPEFSARIARLEAELTGLEWSVLRVLVDEQDGFSPAVAASILKIKGSELQQSLTEIQVDLIGARAARYWQTGPVDRPVSAEWPEHVPGRTAIMMINRAATIYGGALQVQKNILAKLAFGL